MYATFQPTSPMSWGSWILLLVYPALIAGMLVRPPRPLESRSQAWKAVSARLHADPGAVKIIGTANMALGVLLGIYTGILLSAFGARPLWNSALLGPLFLLSGLSSAAAFVHLVARDPQERIMLAKADNAFLGGEMVVIVLFLIGLLSSTRVHIEAANLILTGPFAPAFWVLVVGLGLLIPFVIQMMAVNHRIRHTAVAPIMVIAGGLLLRFVIVNAGQASHWTRALLTR
jgi:formate-dependent nitrite reductase membrane component NrfD